MIMRVLLEVKDNKVDFILELLNNFSFVKAEAISDEKDQLLSDLKDAAEQIRLHKQGKLKLKTAQDLLNEL
jgi:hypothetical protein